MKRLNCGIKLDLRKWLICYMLLELLVWIFLTYSAVYHGKIFDYKYFETANFVAHVNGGDNWYYNIMFGHLNLTTNIEQQKNLQVKCDTLNSLFVFIFGTYFVLTLLFLAGMSKAVGSKCLLCPYVSYDISILISVALFVVYGAFKHIDILDRNGSFFILVKLLPSHTILSYYRNLVN